MRSLAICILFLCVLAGASAHAIPPLLPLLCRPCADSASCGQGQLCWGSKTGMGTCLQACTSDGSCLSGFRCVTLAAGLKHCVPEKNCDMTCNQTSECPTGYTCSLNRCLRPNGGQEGDHCDDKAPCSTAFTCANDEDGASRCVSPCDPQATPPSCAAGFRCLPFGAAKFGCFRESGSQKSGEHCSLFLPCEAGSQCRKESFDAPALCYKSCLPPNPDATCRGLGVCDFIGRTGNYCFCEKDDDCDNKKQCTLIQGPFQRGLCQAGDQTTCATDADCIEDTTCVQGRCTLPLFTEATQEPSAEFPPEPTPEASSEFSAEATKESSSETVNTETPKEFPADQAKTDASEGTNPEDSTERPHSDTALQGGSCHCQSVDPLSLSLGLGWFGLLLLRRRRRPFGSPPPSAHSNA